MKRNVFVFSLLIAFSLSGMAQKKAATELVSTPTHLTKAEFLSKVMNYEKNPSQWVYVGDKPCLIDYYTTWCGPCKRLAPILEELAKEYAGQIYIYKIDTEKEPELASLFAIRSIPTLIFCPMGENPQIAKGLLPKESLEKIINEVLLKKAQ